MPGWLWVVLSCAALVAMSAFAVVMVVRNRPPWDGDDLD